MKWQKFKKGQEASVPVRIAGGRGWGWTTTKIKEDGVLITLEVGEEAVFLTEKFLEEKGFVKIEDIKDSLVYFQGRTITQNLIDEFLADLAVNFDFLERKHEAH